MGIAHRIRKMERLGERFRDVIVHDYPDGLLGEEGKRLILIGYVPYHRIEWIDWDGDEFYPYTHLYLHFDGPKRQPYERLALCEKRELDGRPYYTEVADYEEVRKLSKKRGVKYFA